MISVPRSRERSMASQIRRVLPSRSPTVVLIWAKHTRSILAPATKYTAVGQSRNRAVAGWSQGACDKGIGRMFVRRLSRDRPTARPRDSGRWRLRRLKVLGQRVRFAELGRVAVDRAAPEALRNERYLTPTSNSRFPLANTFLPCNGERGQFGTFVPLLWTMGIRGTIHRNAGWRDGGNAAHSRRTLLPSPDAGSLVTGPVIIRRQDFLRDFFHRLAGAACLTLDLSKCGSFVQPTPAHQDPFGALNQFAGSQRILEAPDVFMQRTDFAKPRQGDFNRRAEVALPHRFDQVGEDAGFLGPVHELTVGVRCQDDHRHGGLGQQGPCRLQAVDSRHLDVEQEEVRAQPAHEC